MRVAITALDDSREAALQEGVIDPLSREFPDERFHFDSGRSTGRNYYRGICFQVHVLDANGNEHFLVDGGATDWTQRLLSNEKERLLISGIGTERACAVLGLFKPGMEN